MSLLPVLTGDSALGRPNRHCEMKQERNMKSRIWMWSSLVYLFAALATLAHGEVVYTPVNINLPANGTYPIHLNHDGISDFTFQTSQTWFSCHPGFVQWDKLYVRPSPLGGIVGGNWALALQSGSTGRFPPEFLWQ